jgi:hypothetical protein
MSCVVCIAFDADRVISWMIPFRGGPVHPYIVWKDRFTWKSLSDICPRFLPEYFSGSSLLYPTSFTNVGVVLLGYE